MSGGCERGAGWQSDNFQVAPGATLTVTSGGGVVANDSDSNGVNSTLSARLLTSPANATSFTFNADGSFTYANDGTAGVVTFTYEATDLNLFSAPVTVTINVAANTNVAPVLTQPDASVVFNEADLPVVLSPNGTVTDPDSTDFASGSLTVELIANGSTDDRLEIRNEGFGAGQIGVVGSTVQFAGNSIGTFVGGVGTAPLVVSFNSNASIASVQATMRNVTFRNISDAPSTLTRSVVFKAVDGDGGPSGGESNVVNQSVDVGATNDTPSCLLLDHRSRMRSVPRPSRWTDCWS